MLSAHNLRRLTRITKYLPRSPGIGVLQGFYARALKPGKLYRIRDFDGDLVFDVDIRECIGFQLWHIPNRYEKKERKLFCSSIQPGSTVLDVGANIGIYTLLAAKRGAKVIALEADPANAAMLRHHVELNGFADAVTIYQVAAVERPQSLTLHRNPTNCGGSSLHTHGPETVTVQGCTIDSLSLPPVDVCKMDIEGAELSALAGMQETIRRSPNMRLLVECAPLSDKSRLLSFLRSRFQHITIAGGKELTGDDKKLPLECNLWATAPR
jgi:FkbM family methyltransferase